MARINLLPWREELRKERKKEFFTQIALAAGLTVAVIGYLHIHVNGMIENQNNRNAYLEKIITEVDNQITEINKLETDKKNMVARMNVIRDLQSSRPGIVHLFDELVRVLPEGLYFTRLDRVGNLIKVEGIAESNARVSSFMRNLESSAWFANPRLVVIDSSKGSAQGSQFQLEVTQVMNIEGGQPQEVAP
ncbi:MAG: hypothetical protein A2V90_03730 [Gammaproteobacteria bacterium RBG_16_57_12]|nr:MAG: hypothetical protein A2V90_03730 [Gammaproteobacteria bacterium RBG_16_57_12]